MRWVVLALVLALGGCAAADLGASLFDLTTIAVEHARTPPLSNCSPNSNQSNCTTR